MAFLFLPQLDFTAVQLQDFTNIVFPEHLLMTMPTNTLKQSILV